MKVTLAQTESGQWQANLYTPDGRDYHGIGPTPGLALVELGHFANEQMRPPSDIWTLLRITADAKARRGEG